MPAVLAAKGGLVQGLVWGGHQQLQQLGLGPDGAGKSHGVID